MGVSLILAAWGTYAPIWSQLASTCVTLHCAGLIYFYKTNIEKKSSFRIKSCTFKTLKRLYFEFILKLNLILARRTNTFVLMS